MQQQGEVLCESQENAQPESQENSNPESLENSCPESQDNTIEVVPDPIPSQVEGDSDAKETVQEKSAAIVPDDTDVENGINDGGSPEPPSSRSKSCRSPKKRHSKADKDDPETAENTMKLESRHDIADIGTADESTPLNDATNDVEGEGLIIVDDQESLTLETSVESCHAEYTVEFAVEDEKKEESLDLVIEEEEEISVSKSALYEEFSEAKSKYSDVSEKYSLTVSSNELSHFTPEFDGQERASVTDKLSGSARSWAGGIRSISARKPVRNIRFVIHGRSSVSTERAATDGNNSDTDCSSEGSIFSSLKRKACDVGAENSKKVKPNDSKNSNFLSMVSSPLRMLKNKYDRVIESPHAPCTEDITNGNNENDDDVTNEKIKIDGNEIKEKSLCVVSNEVNQNSVHRRWCSVM